MSKFQLRWGILATGGIAETFGRDLWVNPETRGVGDIEHVVVAAASSSSRARAQAYLEIVQAPATARAYDSYKMLANDAEVDIIYIATPHSHHYQNAMLCLDAGKSVLCEKTFTTNAAQLRCLINKAREKRLFLMEAVWTRYFPLTQYVQGVVSSKQIGTVYRVFADFSHRIPPEETFADNHRMVNLSLAGGALLDLGIYSLTHVFQVLYSTQENPTAPLVQSSVRKYKTGVDEQTTILLTFPRENGEGDAHAVATTGMRVGSDPDGKGTAGPAIRIQGSTGELQIYHPACRPTRTKLIPVHGDVDDRYWAQPGPGPGSGWANGFGDDRNAEGEGQGMFWEADECAYAIRDGRKESRFQSLNESLVIMETIDEVRRQNNLEYPEMIETIVYPTEL